MTTTDIPIPDYVEIKQPHTICDLASTLTDLLNEAIGLGSPRRAEVAFDEIELAFDRDPGTFRVMAQWAERFGGTLTGEPTEDRDGRPMVRCEIRFVYHAIDVRAYAYVRADNDLSHTLP